MKQWWRHQMEAFSALLAICAGNSPVSGIGFQVEMPYVSAFIRTEVEWYNHIVSMFYECWM